MSSTEGKGAWRVGYSDGSGDEYVVCAETDRPLAAIRWGCGCCKDDGPLTTEEQQRARLIAAGPDMRTALQALFDADEAVIDAEEYDLDASPAKRRRAQQKMSAAWRKARKALAKASPPPASRGEE